MAIVSLAILWLQGTGACVMGKALAIASPAVLLAGLVGGAILFNRKHLVAVGAGVLLLGTVAGGVLWSNYLQYRDVTLAPRARLAELQTIGTMVGGHGPTFFNEYEIYGDRHFLRDGAPVEPEEYRVPQLPTLGGAVLTKPAWANIDSFSLDTLAPYHSLVVRVGPTESLPPSIYTLTWAGRYYQLWQQPAHPKIRVISHTPLGDSLTDAYCGEAENVPQPNPNPLCPVKPASVAPCSQVRSLGRTAAADDAELRAYERTNPIVVRGTDTVWSNRGWSPDLTSQTLVPTESGASTTAHVNVPYGVKGYQLWLGGSFDRGFDVSVDGHPIGSVSNQLEPSGGYAQVGPPLTLSPGVHTITVTYPDANLSPGNADLERNAYDSLSSIILSPPLYPAAGSGQMLMVAASAAQKLCGRTLDWIEVVRRSTTASA